MLSKLVRLLLLVGILYLVFSLFIKLFMILIIVVGCYFIYVAVQAGDRGKFFSAFLSLFLVYMCIVAVVLLNGGKVPDRLNIYKPFSYTSLSAPNKTN